MSKNQEDKIFEACKKGDLQTLSVWIKSGKDLTIRNCDDYSLLHLAVFSNQVKTAEMLLGAGMGIESGSGSSESPTGSAFYYACSYGHLDMVNFLFEKGADINAANPEGITGLMKAAQEGHKEIVRFLLNHDADLSLKDREGAQAIHYLMFSPQTNPPEEIESIKKELASDLLSVGADINARSASNATPLDVARKFCSKEFYQFMVNHGAKASR